MDCKKVKNLLVSYLEGDLSIELRSVVDQHLAVCAGCRMEKELLHKSWETLDDYPAPKVPEDFTYNLMQRIYSEELSKKRMPSYGLPKFVFRPLVPVLTSFLVVVLTFSIFWKRPIWQKQGGAESQAIIVSEQDADIIENLDILENLDLLENVTLLNDLDVVENLNGSA